MVFWSFSSCRSLKFMSFYNKKSNYRVILSVQFSFLFWRKNKSINRHKCKYKHKNSIKYRTKRKTMSIKALLRAYSFDCIFLIAMMGYFNQKVKLVKCQLKKFSFQVLITARILFVSSWLTSELVSLHSKYLSPSNTKYKWQTCKSFN